MIILLASYPKAGSTWVRAFLVNYILDLPTPASLSTITNAPFIIGPNTPPPPSTTGLVFIKTHAPYDQTIHYRKVIYISRPASSIIPSYAAHMNLTTHEASTLVHRQLPKHLMSWVNSISLLLQYDNLPKQFHTLARFLHPHIPYNSSRVDRAIAHSSFRILKQMEADHGFSEASPHTPFFRKGPSK